MDIRNAGAGIHGAMMGYSKETVPAGMQIRPVIMSYLKSEYRINPLMRVRASSNAAIAPP